MESETRVHPCDRPVRCFSGPDLLQVAMPMGGIGAGCICLSGVGGFQDFSIHGAPAISALPDAHRPAAGVFAILHVKARGESPPVTRLIEGPLPPEKIYDQGLQSQGYRHCGHEGLPRFSAATFESAYPFGRVKLNDAKIPLRVEVTGFSPFIPLDDRNSGIPCAIVEYVFHNDGPAAVDFEFSFHASHLALGKGGWTRTRNTPMPEFGALMYNAEPPNDATFGGVALGVIGMTPAIKAMWFRSGWFDSAMALWREVSAGRFTENNGNTQRDLAGTNGASVLVSRRLQAGQSLTIPVVLAWHFPNRHQRVSCPPAPTVLNCGCEGGTCQPPADPEPAWRPYYTTHWRDAAHVARYVRDNYASLRRRTAAFQQALVSSTLPPEVLDAVSSNLAILKSPTVLRQANGNVWGWEGCFTESGCCPGTCTHVWNYAQAMPHLFPALERTLREQELVRSIDAAGRTAFRAALPDGPPAWTHHSAADGQLGGILKLYRDWQISGDTSWMLALYPAARHSIDYCINQWDPDRRGALFEPHHNTYDIDFWGPDGMCGSIYVAALSAMVHLANAAGEPEAAREYDALSRRGAAYLDTELFNGEYYQQTIMWRDLRDRSTVEQIESPDTDPELARILREEGPKYQYGQGCMSDGVIGAWMAGLYGVPTPLSPQHVRTSLASIFRYNFRSDLSEHACTQRPGYAMGNDGGLLVCSWPRGGQLTLPFPYCDEVFTGIEYQVASHMIAEDMVEHGLQIVRTTRQRYEGHVRNPFNEYECGNYYARAMASYALLAALSGFRYSAVERTLWLAPRTAQRPFRIFFSTAGGFGTITLEQRGSMSISMIEGTLEVRQLHLTDVGQTRRFDVNVTATPERAGQIDTAGLSA